MTNWPQQLAPVSGPFSAERIDGAAQGMGSFGPATRSITSQGLVAPDLICGMTLFLLARQPRPARERRPTKASPIAGGVWVREQFTIHRPLDRADAFTVSGASTGRYVRSGRRYGTTTSTTVDSAGRPVATNLTTGLLSYRAEAGLSDDVEGLPLEQTPGPEPDRVAAQANPHLDALRSATVGDRLGGDEVTVSLAMMAARDTSSPDNPIHSDPEEARKAGLDRPIAGGSHVLSFAIEPLLATWGTGVLFHGSRFDIRWKAPTHADVAIVATATVSLVTDEAIEVELDVALHDGTTAMVGTITIPMPA